MSRHDFSGLSAAERERLYLLLEECGETVQAVGKILRHGYERFNPLMDDPPTNREDLEKEIGHVLRAVDFLVNAGDLSKTKIQIARMSRRVNKYLHHQPDDLGDTSWERR